MKMMHILTARQFDRESLSEIFELAKEMEGIAERGGCQFLADCKGIINLFLQPSTRTYASFEIAARLLGGRILCSMPSYTASSMAKGESLKDTIRVFCGYPNVGLIILRHEANFSAVEAASVAKEYDVSIINAGDGTNEHPTQALLDLYTIWKHREGKIDGVRLAVCNDLEKSRTIHSLCLLLVRNFNIDSLITCAPVGISLPQDLKEELGASKVKIETTHDLREVAAKVDFLYMTRPQKEYYKSKEDLKTFEGFKVTWEMLCELDSMERKPPVKIMHPMPIDSERFNEITPEARTHRRSIIYEQASNGLFIRMALLKMLLCPD